MAERDHREGGAEQPERRPTRCRSQRTGTAPSRTSAGIAGVAAVGRAAADMEQRRGDEQHHRAEHQDRDPPAPDLGDGVGARERQRARKPGHQRDLRQHPAGVGSLGADQERRARLVEAGRGGDADQGPDGVELPDRVDQAEQPHQSAGGDRADRHQTDAVAGVDQPPGQRGGCRRDQHRHRERAGQRGLRPAEIGLPMDQQGGEDVERAGPDHGLGHSQRPHRAACDHARPPITVMNLLAAKSVGTPDGPSAAALRAGPPVIKPAARRGCDAGSAGPATARRVPGRQGAVGSSCNRSVGQTRCATSQRWR